MDDRESSYSCHICFQAYGQEGDRMPRILPCGHSFCTQCLRDLGQGLICPTCRRPCGVEPQPNFAVIAIIGAGGVVPSPTVATLCQSSAHVGNAPAAAVYCVECGQNFCEACSNAVHGVLVAHRRVAPRPAVPMCDEHNTQRRELVCQNGACDRALICRDCREFGAHRGHECQLVATIGREQREALATAVAATRLVTGPAEAIATRAAAALAELNGDATACDQGGQSARGAAIARANEAFTQARRDLDARQADVVAAINACADGKTAALDAQRMEVAQLLSRVHVAVAQAETALALDDHSVCVRAAALLQALREVSALRPPAELAATAVIPVWLDDGFAAAIRGHCVVGGPLPPTLLAIDLADPDVMVVTWGAPPSPCPPIAEYIVERAVGDRPWEQVYRGAALRTTLPTAELRGRRVRVRVCGAGGAWAVGETNVPDVPPFLESRILTAHEQRQLGEWTGRGRYRLLFRSSRDGSSAAAFHAHCDGHAHTVTVIRAGDGAAFGGYTARAWIGSGNHQLDRDAFIFNRDGAALERLGQSGIAATAQVVSVYDNALYGPTFGVGHDICVWGGSGTYRNVNQTYQPPRGMKGVTKYALDEVEVFAPA